MWPVKLAISLILLTFVISTDAVSSGGQNVCSYTLQRSYRAQEKYYVSCGWWNWQRCARYRWVTRYRAVRYYQCCSGWVSVDGVHCSKALCYGLPAGQCPNGGKCARPGKCACRAGFAAPKCTDIDECFRDNGGCQHRCINTHGSYKCTCYRGYGLISDRKSCKPECNGSSPGICPNGGVCVRPNRCSCRAGTVLPWCADIDECSCGNGGCQHGCSNTQGSRNCTCNSGYGLLSDGRSCRPVCHGWNPGSCPNGGVCVAPNRCWCRSGYALPACTFGGKAFNVDFENNRPTLLSETTRESKIQFWQEQCFKYKQIREFVYRGFRELLSATGEIEATPEEFSTRGSETIRLLSDSGIDYNIYKDELAKKEHRVAEYILNGNDAAKLNFTNSDMLPTWREQMENDTKNILWTDECSGFYDCTIRSVVELYQLAFSVDPNLVPGTQDILPELEAHVNRLFENDSMTLADIKATTLEILNILKMLKGENVFCGTVPIITNNPTDITTTSGEDVTLSCTVESDPPPTYYWYKDEELFASGLDVVSLNFKTVSSDDNGEYVCVGGNHVANVTSYPASINVVFPPKILTKLPTQLEFAEGERVNILCNVSATPEANITWYLASTETAQTHTKNLFFPVSKLSDSGLYRCEARNEHGVAVSNEMKLTVLEASGRCVTVKLQVGFVSGNAQDVTVNETLLQEDFTGLSLEAAFRQTVLALINSTASGLTVKIMVSATVVNIAEVVMTSGCDSSSVKYSRNNSQADIQEFITYLAGRMQNVMVSDEPLFILDGLVYHFSSSNVIPLDQWSECPPGFTENPRNICVKSDENAATERPTSDIRPARISGGSV